MTPEELRRRTNEFALQVVRFSRPLSTSSDGRHVASQLMRAAMSTAANYRAAGRARSHREFTSRLGVVLEEADESLHWLEFMRDAGLASGHELSELLAEAGELTAIFAASHRTAKARGERKTPPR